MCPAVPPLPETPPPPTLAANLGAVLTRITAAARSVGRDPGEVRLLAVTKRVGSEVAADLARLGQLDLGENRVQELEQKAAAVAALGVEVRWHMIGHLQRNKARRAARLVDTVHSVDSARLLEALDRTAAEEGRAPRVYLEVQLTADGGRTGLRPEDLRAAVEVAARLEHVVPVGLMTMAPAPAGGPSPAGGADPLERQGAARAVFRCLRELRDDLAPRYAEAFSGSRIELSMGMSADLEAAVAEGADVVRIGTALFEGLAQDGGGREAAQP